MPELPEVETVARTLRGALKGLEFRKARLARADVYRGSVSLASFLPGRTVEDVVRRGKRLILELPAGDRLMFHLGMSGRLLLAGSADRPEAHTHLRISFNGSDRELRFRDPRRFGGIWLVRDGEEAVGRCLGPLGPEPLDMKPFVFANMVDRPRMIKALLLDQKMIAGLGNIYCDESLFDASVHPELPANALRSEDAKRLLRSIKKILRRAIRFKGTTLVDFRTASGDAGGFRKFHQVYGREGESCTRCGHTISRIVVAGRSTFVCESCQPVGGLPACRGVVG